MNHRSRTARTSSFDSRSPASAEGEARWAAAASFAALRELAADFLCGELDHFPGWMAGSTDEETDALLPALLELSRAGLLPLASQPGHPRAIGHDGREWSRRAFLNGFATADAAARCAARAERAGLVWRSWPARELGREREAVGLRGGEPFLWAGRAAGGIELEIFDGALSGAAWHELSHTRYVSAYDPVWGRPTRLFDVLAHRR